MGRILFLRWRWVRLMVPGIILLSSITFFLLGSKELPVTAPPASGELKEHLTTIFTARARALTDGKYKGLEVFYDATTTSGRFALNHEIGRIKYIQEWLQKRQVTLTGSHLDLAVVDSGSEGDKGWASVSQHLILSYRHQGEASKIVNQMGFRTLHWVELVKKDGRWLITRDWYWDPFETDDLKPAIAPGTAVCKVPPPPVQGKYRRQAAVAYADRYSGVRVGPGDGRYNQDYRDLTGLGGDCANFASQVLSDKNAGGIPRDWVWNYHNGEGSQAWAQAAGLVCYLLDSGLAVRLARGNFHEVTRATAAYPYGAVNALQPGDIIGYEEGGEVSHVSVVAGRDASGYVLVDSHTADRYHVPWDMGWEDRTIYWLLQVVY